VQLHVVQELLELFNLEEIDILSSPSDSEEQLFLAISKEAVLGT
jgi:hypothetical protein